MMQPSWLIMTGTVWHILPDKAHVMKSEKKSTWVSGQLQQSQILSNGHFLFRQRNQRLNGKANTGFDKLKKNKNTTKQQKINT